MCVVVWKTVISLPIQRVRKHVFVGLFGYVCHVYTEVHMSHVLFCSYISVCDQTKSSWEVSELQHTSTRNGVKNVTHPWNKMLSLMTHRRFHVTCSHMFLCVPTRKSTRSTIKINFIIVRGLDSEKFCWFWKWGLDFWYFSILKRCGICLIGQWQIHGNRQLCCTYDQTRYMFRGSSRYSPGIY